MPRKQRSCTVKQKLAAIARIEEIGLLETIDELDHPPGTVDSWWRARERLRAFKGTKTTKGQGRKESFPFTPALVTFMNDIRRDEEWLTTSIMIGLIEHN
ncbi:hypothetical protein V7S43_011213 [Phytophthora oleae]|uniref:Uncharacterized protein n=1 Tax=Phytophthora oleae TaxID=2107226 RepID=A0ABD3FFL9_9STRA